MSEFHVKFKRFDKNLPALFQEDDGNAGHDLFARLDQPIVIPPGGVRQIHLNVATQFDKNLVALLFQRSSTHRKWGIKLTNNVGIIDSTFSGDGDEYIAEFKNVSNQPKTIKNGDKICQVVFLELPQIIKEEVDVLGNEDRGGFGTSFDSAEVLTNGK